MSNWKDPPKDTSKLWLNPSLELQITLKCSWSCTACDSFSQFHSVSFTRQGTMSLDQIRYFVTEIQDNNAYFGRIRILGGEPTGHPSFATIVSILYNDLVVPGYIGHLEVITNGTGQDKIEPVRHFLHKVRVSGERDKQKNHTANMVHTPASLGYEGKRCGQPEFCGWSLCAYGYSPCSSGAGIMRLRSLMEHQRLSLPIVRGTESNWPEIQKLCNLCYHGLRDSDKIKCGTGTLPGQHELNTPSPEVWGHLAPWLSGKTVDWPMYGASGDAAEKTREPLANETEMISKTDE